MSSMVLLVGLSNPEMARLESWIRALDPAVTFHHASHLSSAVPTAAAHVRLGVLKVRDDQRKPWRDVSKFRRFLPSFIPLLVLIPSGQARLIRHCVKAGADDYWILPFNEEGFLPRLQVLLEWADASEAASERQGLSHAGVAREPSRFRLLDFLGGLFISRGRDVEVPASGPLPMGGRWRPIRNLGGGSYGEVWEVVDEGTGEHAVAKIPHSVKMNRRFIQEASILKRFRDHPHAVHMKEIVREGGKVVLIQEFVEGRTLQAMLDEGMEAREKEKTYLQLVQVVAHGHDQNIMHRDIKPENIIVQPSGDVKLLDFGTGKDLMGGSVSSTIIGSRPYMSPEQIKGESCLGSDVWALGVILYAFATGLIPFYYENEKALMDAILECDPERPTELEPGLSGELERIILKCLRKDPGSRYGTAGELLEDLLQTFPRFGEGEVLP